MLILLKYYSYNDETIIDLQNCVKNINEDAFIILTYPSKKLKNILVKTFLINVIICMIKNITLMTI
jgi:hypothetical protein